MRRALVAAVLFASLPACAADDFTIDCNAVIDNCQGAFAGVVEDIGAALNYKAVGPAEATGITGIAVAAVGSYAPVQNGDDWRTLTGSEPDAVGMAGVTVRKGLPFNIDVGAFYSTVPGASASLYGGELRYAILPGGVTTPALAVRASYIRSAGIDDFDYDALAGDVSVSKGFAIVTPYLGAGVVRATADPHDVAGLHKVRSSSTRVFAGFRLGLGLLDIIPEYEHIGGNSVYNLAVGLSF